MTRINLVDVAELYDQHLLSEHREIKRIPNVIAFGRYIFAWIPDKYVLWTGHVKFFYDKLLFLHNRYKAIYKECKKRGFQVENYEKSFKNMPEKLYNNYTPTPEAIEINRGRLQEKYRPNFYKYYWKIK